MKLLLPLREMSFAFNPDATLCIFCYIYGKYRKPYFQITEGKVQGVRTTTEGVLLYKGIS